MKLSPTALLFAVLAAACGGQDIDTGTSTSDAGSGGSTGTGTGGAGGAPQGLADVLLVYNDTSGTVDVATLATVDYKGSALVRLTALWDAGKLHADTSTLEFDFYGDDGYHPSEHASCSWLPTGADLQKGYIQPDTRNLVWDDSLGAFGCYKVKGIAKMIGIDAAK